MLVGVSSAVAGDRGRELLSLYDRTVGDVYGSLLTRCRNRDVAEDVTAEVFMAAVEAVQRDTVADVSPAWLIGIARHKLVDHWRRAERASTPSPMTRPSPGPPATTHGTGRSTCSPPATPWISSAPTTAPP